MRIGIDVGGTNTDAVLMDGVRVRGHHKARTTADVGSGIITAIRRLLNDAMLEPREVDSVMIGTTHFTNAVVQRRNLLNVGIIRIALPATRGLLPLVDWPKDFRKAVEGSVHLVRGGYQYDGRLNSTLDENGLADAARAIRGKGIRSVAITGLFSPVNKEMELRAAEIVTNEIPDVRVTLSHNIGRLGLLERENAAIINAALAELSVAVIDSMRQALDELGIEAPFFISQNDGTLMHADFVVSYPVLTFASGPTNSMRGAANLTGISNGIVIDIGGTTTDIGVLVDGFPRESSTVVHVGGVRTNFRMPDLLSIGLGGGSLVSASDPSEIGPQSVGYDIHRRAMIFGGDTLTATDIAVAAGLSDLGNRSRVSHLSPSFVEQSMQRIRDIVEDGIDRMKTSADPVPLILVGGGSMLVSRNLEGASQVVVPEFATVANAVGAAIAQVGGETDRVFSYATCGRDDALAAACAEATAAAIQAGAVPGSVRIVESDEIPLAYVPNGAVRVRVKAVGDLHVPASFEDVAGRSSLASGH